MTKIKGQQQGIQSVEVAVRTLEAMERLGAPAALSAIAEEGGISPSTTHRYLVSLIRTGLVHQDATNGLYDFGPAARRLGLEAIRRSDDVNTATIYARKLRDATAHTVNLSVWTDHGPTIVRWEYGTFPLPIIARVGSTLPVVDSSVGRVFLAHLPRILTSPVIKSQQRYGESSTPSREHVNAIIDDVRRDGHSTTVNGVTPGLTVVAAPAFGSGGALSVVFACTIPTRAMKPRTLEAVQQVLLDTVAALGADLGS